MNTTPEIVVLCGSTRFRDEMTAANRDLTLAGCIVLAPGVFGHSGDAMTDAQKVALDALHLRKIDMADRVLVVSPGGYVGASTSQEIEHAQQTGKPVAYTDPPDGCDHDDLACPVGACIALYPPYREDMGR